MSKKEHVVLTASGSDDNASRSNAGGNNTNTSFRPPNRRVSYGHSYDIMFIVIRFEQCRNDYVVNRIAYATEDLAVGVKEALSPLFCRTASHSTHYMPRVDWEATPVKLYGF